MTEMNGHRKRLRERYFQGGYSSFLDYEKLELLLTYSIGRKDVKSIAKELIKKFGSLEGVLKASKEELLKVSGIGEASVVFIRLICDLSKDIFRNSYSEKDITSISGTSDLLAFLKNDIGFSPVEEFKVIYLDNSNNFLGEKTLFSGTIDKSSIYPRNIVESVIGYRAKSVIFAHNHPSGNLTPSKADREFTQKIAGLLETLDIRVLDHIIITRDSYFSFLENGLIEFGG